jgi:hypothetical protein
MGNIPKVDLAQVPAGYDGPGNYAYVRGDASLYPNGAILWSHGEAGTPGFAAVNLSKDWPTQGSDNPSGVRYVRTHQLVPVRYVEQAEVGDFVVARVGVRVRGYVIEQHSCAQVVDVGENTLTLDTDLAGPEYPPRALVEKDELTEFFVLSATQVQGAVIAEDLEEALQPEDAPAAVPAPARASEVLDVVKQVVRRYAQDLGYRTHGERVIEEIDRAIADGGRRTETVALTVSYTPGDMVAPLDQWTWQTVLDRLDLPSRPRIEGARLLDQ